MIQAVAWSPSLWRGRSRFGVDSLWSSWRSFSDDSGGGVVALWIVFGFVAGEFVDSVWRCRSGLYDPGGAWYAPPGVQKGC